MRIHFLLLSFCWVSLVTPSQLILTALEEGPHRSVYRTFCARASGAERIMLYSCLKNMLTLMTDQQVYQCLVTILTAWHQRRARTQKRKLVMIALCLGGIAIGGGACWWQGAAQKNRDCFGNDDRTTKHGVQHSLDIFPDIGPDEQALRRKPPGLGPAVTYLRRHARALGGALRAAAHASVVYAALKPQEKSEHAQERPVVRMPSYAPPPDETDNGLGLSTGVVAAGGLAAGAVGGYLLARQHGKKYGVDNFLPGPEKK